ncbi:DUF3231 family protein [Thalassobacillus sp. B23F22_16]|uniref:DUF3231 family protein n=1 Tax=Thalassobacillus sp. B23F22_16 TaxID=3459513 RepID=UPI00373E93D4
MKKNEELQNQISEHQQNKQLTSAELADMFNNYLGDSLFSCMYEHFLQLVEDDEVRDYVKFALALSKKHMKEITDIFQSENIPVPVGFGEQDIRKDAPRLFSDEFMVFYIVQMSSSSIVTYGNAFSTSSRQDIMQYFRERLNDSAETYERGKHLLLLKGIDTSYPNIPYATKVDFVEKKSYISLITGRERPLTANEIKQMQYNIFTNILGKTLMLGFSQVASSEKIRKYFRAGAELSGKQINSFSQHLTNQDLPAPTLMDEHITDSTSSPFSDKLMIYHGALAGNIALSNLGTALSQIFRHDLAAEFVKLIPIIGKYNNDGINIMIEHGWFEEPFMAADRERLSKSSKGI